MTVQDLASMISSYRYTFSSESELQEQIAGVLDASGVPNERELALGPKDRLDFLVTGDIAVEVKIASSRSEVLRQLHRYAQSERIAGIVLVTNRARHIQMPDSLNGKPVRVASLLGGAF